MIKIIHLPFFFFFHSLMPLSLSLSLSSLKLTLSTLVSLSQLWSPIHKAWLKLTLSTPITDPRSSPSIGVPDWETYGACHWLECLLVDIGSFTPPMVVSRRRSEIWDFFFLPAVDCWWWWLSSLKLTLSTPITDQWSSSSIGVPDCETHGARCWSECLLVDIGSFTPLMVVSRCRSEIWVFFFLLWIGGGGGGVDRGCGCGCEEKDWRFGFFFFFFCCGVVVVVLMVVVAVVVFVSNGGIYYFIGVIILFYCNVYIILLC